MPIVPCEIVMDDGQRGEIWLSDEDSKNLFRHLTNWKWLSTMLPALAETLESMFGGTVHLEAKLPEHMRLLLFSWVRFSAVAGVCRVRRIGA